MHFICRGAVHYQKAASELSSTVAIRNVETWSEKRLQSPSFIMEQFQPKTRRRHADSAEGRVRSYSLKRVLQGEMDNYLGILNDHSKKETQPSGMAIRRNCPDFYRESSDQLRPDDHMCESTFEPAVLTHQGCHRDREWQWLYKKMHEPAGYCYTIDDIYAHLLS